MDWVVGTWSWYWVGWHCLLHSGSTFLKKAQEADGTWSILFLKLSYPVVRQHGYLVNRLVPHTSAHSLQPQMASEWSLKMTESSLCPFLAEYLILDFLTEGFLKIEKEATKWGSDLLYKVYRYVVIPCWPWSCIPHKHTVVDEINCVCKK